jgi:hypothetical protein
MQNILFTIHFKECIYNNNYLQLSHRDKYLITNTLLYKSYNYDQLAKYLETKYKGHYSFFELLKMQINSSQKDIDNFMFFLNGINNVQKEGQFDEKSIKYVLDGIESKSVQVNNALDKLPILSSLALAAEFLYKKNSIAESIKWTLALYTIMKLFTYPAKFLSNKITIIDNILDKCYNMLFGYEELYQKILNINGSSENTEHEQKLAGDCDNNCIIFNVQESVNL